MDTIQTFRVEEDGRVYFEAWEAGRSLKKRSRRVVTAAEAARILGRSHRHLYRLIERDWLRPVARFAGQYFFGFEEVRSLAFAGAVLRTPVLPRRLAPLFPEYDRHRLHLKRDADLIISRILERGDRAALRWSRSHYSEDRLKEFLRQQGSRLLSPRAPRFWSWLWHVRQTPGGREGWRQAGRALGGTA